MKTVLPVIAVLLLCACSDQPAEQKKKVATPWDPQIKTLNDAKGLEDQMLNDAQERDKKLREMGG